MMKIFHTADVHLGLKFTRASYSQATQKSLVDARMETLARMVEMANDQQCDLFVVAGDLFDTTRIPKKMIKKAAEVLRRFESVVAVLPGNHDYIKPGDENIWPMFEEHLGEGNVLLQADKPQDLRPNLNGVIYPGVCKSKHSQENAIGWIAEEVDSASDAIRIGVAHGSLDGLSPDFNGDYFPMTHKELEESGMHVWLLGHTHLRYPAQESGKEDRLFYPSVPEPDGFDCGHDGFAWIIQVNSDGAVTYESVQTGTYRFHRIDAELRNEDDINQLRGRFESMRPESDLVKLNLTGRLAGDLYQSLGDLEREISDHVFHLEPVGRASVVREIGELEINKEFTEGSFPHQLLMQLVSDDDVLALQLAYELMRETK